MNTQSTIRIDHIAERMSTARLWTECAELDINRGDLASVKKRIERIREIISEAEASIDEELAMPKPKTEAIHVNA